MVEVVHQGHLEVGAGAEREPRQAAETATHDHDSWGRSSWSAPSERRVYAPRRSSRWSPTRSAFAIAVSAGLTAPMLGKKLVSTT